MCAPILRTRFACIRARTAKRRANIKLRGTSFWVWRRRTGVVSFPMEMGLTSPDPTATQGLSRRCLGVRKFPVIRKTSNNKNCQILKFIRFIVSRLILRLDSSPPLVSCFSLSKIRASFGHYIVAFLCVDLSVKVRLPNVCHTRCVCNVRRITIAPAG